MARKKRNERAAGLVAAVFAFTISCILALALMTSFGFLRFAFASSNTTNVVASANVVASCFISTSPNTINFGNVPAGGSTVNTVNAVTVNDPFGNAPANIFVAGANWLGPSTDNFFVSNTVWAASNVATISGATPLVLFNGLMSSFVDTSIQIPAPNAVANSPGNFIFFGAQVPLLTPIATYTQNIFIEEQC